MLIWACSYNIQPCFLNEIDIYTIYCFNFGFEFHWKIKSNVKMAALTSSFNWINTNLITKLQIKPLNFQQKVKTFSIPPQEIILRKVSLNCQISLSRTLLSGPTLLRVLSKRTNLWDKHDLKPYFLNHLWYNWHIFTL